MTDAFLGDQQGIRFFLSHMSEEVVDSVNWRFKILDVWDIKVAWLLNQTPSLFIFLALVLTLSVKDWVDAIIDSSVDFSLPGIMLDSVLAAWKVPRLVERVCKLGIRGVAGLLIHRSERLFFIVVGHRQQLLRYRMFCVPLVQGQKIHVFFSLINEMQ